MSAQLAVLGSPIAHSQSPQLHLAAYRQLGLDWTYERIEVSEAELSAFLSGPGRAYRGCSVTAPLKAELLRLSAAADEVARLSGAANTVIDIDLAPRVFNTDVAGITGALRARGLEAARHVILLGGGATAASALIAAAELGAETVDLRLRSPRKAGELITLGRELGLMVLVDDLNPNRAEVVVEPSDVLISALPAQALDQWARAYAGLAPYILDVAYDPWPSALAAANLEAAVVSGLEMLLEQALVQVRIFVAGDPLAPLPDEGSVRAAMRSAIPALCQD